MARTISQIYDEMIAEKENMNSLNELQPSMAFTQTLLQDLTNTAKVAMWRLLFWVVAYALWVHEALIADLAAQSETGTLRWYYDTCLAFQYGSDLVYSNGKYIYNPIIDDAKIVKLAAAIETNNGQLLLKVAKLNNTTPIPLNVDELASFNAYISLVKFAGTNILVISQDADILMVNYDVYYNPLVMNPDGSLITDIGTYPVRDAINTHLKTLKFNGVLALSRLTDAVQLATGVVNVVCTAAVARKSYEPDWSANIITTPGQYYNPEAGYMAISDTVDEGLEATINYIPA
jgi:hypothetical protein